VTKKNYNTHKYAVYECYPQYILYVRVICNYIHYILYAGLSAIVALKSNGKKFSTGFDFYQIMQAWIFYYDLAISDSGKPFH
jgi:hypothetical protein